MANRGRKQKACFQNKILDDPGDKPYRKNHQEEANL
jgi:hypothetical protein